MKIITTKVFICFYTLLCSFTGYAQNNFIDSLKNVLQRQKEDTAKVNTLNEIGKALLTKADYQTSMQYSNTALSISEKTTFKKGKSVAYKNIGYAYYGQNNRLEAEKHWYTALNLFEELGDKQNIADTYDLLRGTYFEDENYPEMIKYSYSALKLYEELGDKKNIAMNLHDIGAVYFLQGNYPEALEKLLAALKIREELGDMSGIAQSYTVIGNVYDKQGGYNEALEMHFAALKIFQKPRMPSWGVPLSYESVATVYEQQGNLANAAGNKSDAINKFSEAQKNYLAALRLREQINDMPSVAADYINLGGINIKLKNIPIAKDYLQKGLQLSTTLANKTSLRDCYYYLSILDSIKGNYREAFEHYKMFTLYRDSVLNEEGTSKIARSKMQYEFDKKEAFTKAEQEKKDTDVERTRNLQYAAIIIFLLIAAFFYFNSRQKQKAKRKIEKAYTELKSTQAQLIQSEKMASLGELTAGIAHEIQNPLNFVNNFSEVNKELVDEMQAELRAGKIDDAIAISEDIKDNEEKINHHGKRADAIVKGMLQHSRSSSGVKEPTNINALCDEYLRLSYHGLRAKDKSFNATMKTDFDETIGNINIIPQDIGRVILNLINNAFYAVSEKKKIARENFEPTITVSTKKMGSKVEVSVKDNGKGIPQKVLDKIFQPFFTTKPTGQGTGLGLSLSYDIIKAHGGEIKVNSKEAAGSEFIIQLPVV